MRSAVWSASRRAPFSSLTPRVVRPEQARATGGLPEPFGVDVEPAERDVQRRPLAGERQSPGRRERPDPHVVAPEPAATTTAAWLQQWRLWRLVRVVRVAPEHVQAGGAT